MCSLLRTYVKTMGFDGIDEMYVILGMGTYGSDEMHIISDSCELCGITVQCIYRGDTLTDEGDPELYYCQTCNASMCHGCHIVHPIVTHEPCW